jgi:hypothetical protein
MNYKEVGMKLRKKLNKKLNKIRRLYKNKKFLIKFKMIVNDKILKKIKLD